MDTNNNILCDLIVVLCVHIIINWHSWLLSIILTHNGENQTHKDACRLKSYIDVPRTFDFIDVSCDGILLKIKKRNLILI